MNNKNKSSHKKKNLKSILGYISFSLLFTILSGPFTLLYGPFENAKKIYVGSAMATMTHQWLATMFLSQEKIDDILGVTAAFNDESNDMNSEDTSSITFSSNRDATIEKKIITDENKKFKGYALIVNDPTRVRIGVSSKLFEEGEPVSTIAENYGAVAAINGGYFDNAEGAEEHTSNGGIPSEFLMSNGEVLHQVSNPNKKTPILALTKEGKLLIGETTTSELLSTKENDKDTVVDAMSYLTTLVKNGKRANIEKDEGSSPKTMIGQRLDGAIVLVVLDSITLDGRLCATLKEGQTVMLELNCYNAVNLDGGKSTTMYYKGEVINTPSYFLGERPISSGFVVINN